MQWCAQLYRPVCGAAAGTALITGRDCRHLKVWSRSMWTLLTRPDVDVLESFVL